MYSCGVGVWVGEDGRCGPPWRHYGRRTPATASTWWASRWAGRWRRWWAACWRAASWPSTPSWPSAQAWCGPVEPPPQPPIPSLFFLRPQLRPAAAVLCQAKACNFTAMVFAPPPCMSSLDDEDGDGNLKRFLTTFILGKQQRTPLLVVALHEGPYLYHHSVLVRWPSSSSYLVQATSWPPCGELLVDARCRRPLLAWCRCWWWCMVGGCMHVCVASYMQAMTWCLAPAPRPCAGWRSGWSSSCPRATARGPPLSTMPGRGQRYDRHTDSLYVPASSCLPCCSACLADRHTHPCNLRHPHLTSRGRVWVYGLCWCRSWMKGVLGATVSQVVTHQVSQGTR